MRPYLAIIKDSFREALASRVLWILLLLITVVFLGIAPLGWSRQLTSRIAADDIRRVDEFARRLDSAKSLPNESPEKRVYGLLDDGAKSEISKFLTAGEDDQRMRRRGLSDRLATSLDEMLEETDLYEEEAWSGFELEEEGQALLSGGLENLEDEELRRFNRLAMEAAFPRHVRSRPNRSVVFTYFHWVLGVPLPMTDEQVEEMIQGSLLAFMYVFVGVIGIFCGILVTASIIPNTFDAGSVNLLLSKPISRSLLYLSKFAGGCSFVFINATYLIVGLWLIVGWRLGIWNSRLLLCIPVFLFLFILYYAVSGLAGLIWRNTVVCISITILFWFACFVVGLAKGVIDTFVHNPTRIVRLTPVEDELFAATENGDVLLWDKEIDHWRGVFQTGTPTPPFGGALLNLRVGPIYDSANERLIQVERGWSNKVFVGTSPRWDSNEVGAAPTDTLALLSEPDGRVVALTSSSVARFRDRIIPEDERPKVFGIEIPLPGVKGAYQDVKFEPALSLNRATNACIAKDTGRMFFWKDGELRSFDAQDDGYVERKKVTISEESQRAAMAASAKALVVARSDGIVQILDVDSLESQSEYQPADNDPPRYVVVSPSGRYFAVVFHTRELWVYDAESAAPVDWRWSGQGDISAAQFAKDDQLLVVDRGNRVTHYDASNGNVVNRQSPAGSVMQRVSWYVVNPIYTIFPRPSELNETTKYILTGKETTSLVSETEALDSMYVSVDPWAPVWSSAGFTIVVLIFSCLYISRQEF